MKVTQALFAGTLFFLGCFFLYTNYTHQKVDTRKIVITAFGDSLTEGYALPYEDSYTAQLERLLRARGFPGVTIYNKGKSGDTSLDGVKRVEEVIAQKPDVAIVAFGGNDGLRRLPANLLKDNLLLIVSALQQNHSTVLLVGIEPPHILGPKYAEDFKRVYEEVAKEKKVLLVPNIMEGVALHPNLTIEDGLHPNKSGYTIIAEKNMYAKVVEAIGLIK